MSTEGPHQPGQESLGRYPITGRLGAGGIGEVFCVHDPELGRTVAAKVLQHPDDPFLCQAFTLEARIMGHLAHPNIVPVHELGTDAEGRPYFTMRRVEGETMHELLVGLAGGSGRRGAVTGLLPDPTDTAFSAEVAPVAPLAAPPQGAWVSAKTEVLDTADRPAVRSSSTEIPSTPSPPPASPPITSELQLLQMFLKVCEAMSYAHSRGVIHCDLKPANIMLGRYGEVQVMDWGLARLIDDAETQLEDISPQLSVKTQARLQLIPRPEDDPLERVMGTPAYMSPEQAEGNADRLDLRSDIYALGAILYHMLTLVPPYCGEDSREILDKVKGGDLVPPSERNPQAAIPWELEAVVMRAMARKKSQRYQTVDALRRDVERYLDDRTLMAARYNPLQRVVKFVKRHKTAAKAVTVVLFAASIVAGLQFGRMRSQQQATEKSLDKTRGVLAVERGEREKVEAKLSIARDQLVRGLLLQVDQALTDRRLLEAAVYLAEARRIDNGPRTRAATLALPAPWITLDRIRSDHLRAVKALAYAPGGGHLATAAEQSVRLLDRRNGKSHVLKGHLSQITHLAFSRDGTRLASADDQMVLFWSTRTATLVGQHALMSPIRAMTFSPRGRLAMATDDKAVRVLNPGTGQFDQVIHGEAPVLGLAYSPDGNRLASAGADGTVRIYDPASGETAHRLAGSAGAVLVTRFSPDGQLLAAGSEDSTVQLWEVPTGKLMRTFTRHQKAVTRLAFSPDGAHLVSLSEEDTLRLWRTADGRLLQTLTGPGVPLTHMAYADDGRSLATGSPDGSIRLWRVELDRPSIWHHGEAITGLGFAPDGRLATAGRDGQLRLWAPDTREAIGRRKLPGARHLAFGPAGKLLAGVDGDGVVRLWREGEDKPRALEDESGEAHRVAFSADGQRLLVGTLTGNIVVWDVRATEPTAIKRWSAHSGPVTALAVYPEGQVVLSGGARDGGKIWAVEMAAESQTLDGHAGGISSAAFSPTGKLAATAGDDGQVRLWALVDARWILVHLIPHRHPVSAVAFSDDGALLATASQNGIVRLIDPATGQRLQALRDRPGAVTSIAFRPGGGLLAAVGGDNRVRLWGAGAPASMAAAKRASGFALSNLKLVPIPGPEFAELAGDGTQR